LLDAVAIRSPLVAVEINGQVISRSQHGQFLLSDGDVVEAVTLVGGG
jgi:sulfur carrier protein